MNRRQGPLRKTKTNGRKKKCDRRVFLRVKGAPTLIVDEGLIPKAG